ncbi:hypothetical protein GCM10009740_11290 [Terrabacter terrae]|uniref:Uncharacterized protein n=1 Tax=Terrabacter terrae TaxID=318434 RepID=A0ABN2TXQ4_9MICO
MRAAPSSMEYSVCTWRCTKFWSFLGAASVDIVDESKPRRGQSPACRARVSRQVFRWALRRVSRGSVPAVDLAHDEAAPAHEGAGAAYPTVSTSAGG